MTEKDLINAGFTKVHVAKEESGDNDDYSYYLLEVTEGITLVSDSPIGDNGINWVVHSFELDKISIIDPQTLFNFLETIKICTQANW